VKGAAAAAGLARLLLNYRAISGKTRLRASGEAAVSFSAWLGGCTFRRPTSHWIRLHYSSLLSQSGDKEGLDHL